MAKAMFIFVAIPGLALFLFSLGLSMRVLDPRTRTFTLALLVFLGLLVGLLAVLAGTRRWGQWLHLVLLVSFPFVFIAFTFMFAFISGHDMPEPLLPAGVVTAFLAIWASRRIDRHYRERANRNPLSRPGV
jgi:peptidoglycan/LPS O-acetylase OafA/YrhL